MPESITTKEGYTYTPFSTGRAVGFVATAPNGQRQCIFLSPALDRTDGFTDVALYVGEIADTAVYVGEPTQAADLADDFLAAGELHDPAAVRYVNIFDEATTADTLARYDLKTMCIGAAPTAQEIELRAAEHADRIKFNMRGTTGMNAADAQRRTECDGEHPVDLRRIVRWLEMYGVSARVDRSLGGALLTVADTIRVGYGWFEGTAQSPRPYACPGDFRIVGAGQAPEEGVIVPHSTTELEVAWLAVNMLTGQPLWNPHDNGHRSVAKATPVHR